MSFKRQIKYQYQQITTYVETFALPEWVGGLQVRLILVGLAMVLSVIYVCETSSAATSGYKMHDLENQVGQLQSEIQKVQVQIADESSMVRLEQRLNGSGMVAVGQVKYLTPVESVVAKR